MKLKHMPQLSDRLIFVRKIFNLSQVDLAQKAGTTQQAIQQAEKGKARQPRYLNRLAHELDIPVEWMVFGEAHEDDNKKPPSKSVNGLREEHSEVIDNFFAMPETDQKLILELMKSRKEN